MNRSAKLIELYDAFHEIFGITAEPILKSVLENVGHDARLLGRRFGGAVANCLDEIQDHINDPIGDLRVPKEILDDSFSNPFYQNPHACGLALVATKVHQERRSQDSDATIAINEFVAETVARYLAWAHYSPILCGEAYQGILDLDTAASDSQRRDALEKFAERLDSTVDDPVVLSLASSLRFLLDVLAIVREKREEQTRLTLDLGVPIEVAWFDFGRRRASHLRPAGPDVYRARGDTWSDTRHQPEYERFLALNGVVNLQMKDVVEEFEKAGMVLGRGTARLAFRRLEKDERQGILRLESAGIWLDHRNAPLSRLYWWGWERPEVTSNAENIRFILLPNGTIKVESYGDPLLEKFLGTWRYVDLAWKSKWLSHKLLATDWNEDSLGSVTFYRILRMAHQLGYHNHGGNMVFHMNDGYEDKGNKIGEELEEIDTLWTLGYPNGIVVPSSSGLLGARFSEVPEEEVSLSNGRLVYSLAVQDGTTHWNMDEEGDIVRLTEWHDYSDSDKDRARDLWKERCGAMKLPTSPCPISGGRHRAAFLSSKTKGDKRRVVLCISQDGYVDAYHDGLMLRIR